MNIRVVIGFCFLSASLVAGCQSQRKNSKSSANVVSEMTTAAANRDYVGGIAIGENYLRDNPEDTFVLQQTAILTITQARQDQSDREPLVARAVSLIERSIKSSHSQKNVDRFTDAYIAARTFESAGDLSSNKCPYYRRALVLNDEAAKALKRDSVALGGGKEVPTKPLQAQSTTLRSDLEKRVSEARCGNN